MPFTPDPDHPEIQTPAEEAVNCITHGVGAALAAAALAVLVTLAVLRGGAIHIVSVSVYGACLLGLYLASTIYHACGCGSLRSRQRLRRALKIIDHIGIYLLIAGTYTPFLLVLIRGPWGWSLFGVLWGLAVVGTIYKMLFIDDGSDVISALLYVAMGWVGMIGAKPLLGALPGGAVAWIVAGGIAYTAGVAFYLWERLPFNHAIWHGFVLAGSACHFLAILLYVLPAAA
jgi:hemolysin III